MVKALGDLWMEYGEIIVLISAAVTLIGVVFTLFRNNSISNATVDKVESKGNQLSGENGKLSAEHDKLAAEHSIQCSEHKSILDKVVDAKSEISEVRKTVSDVNMRLIQADADNKVRFVNLDEAQKKLCSSAENMGKFADEFMRIVTENKQLREENALLKDRISKLVQRLENERMQRDNSREDNEMEIG